MRMMMTSRTQTIHFLGSPCGIRDSCDISSVTKKKETSFFKITVSISGSDAGLQHLFSPQIALWLYFMLSYIIVLKYGRPRSWSLSFFLEFPYLILGNRQVRPESWSFFLMKRVNRRMKVKKRAALLLHSPPRFWSVPFPGIIHLFFLYGAWIAQLP